MGSTNLPDGQITQKSVKPLWQKYSDFPKLQISLYPPHPVPLRGAFRERHGTSGRDAVDEVVRETGDLAADGQVVWSWHLDAGVKLAVGPAGDGGKRARSPGRARRKP